LNTICHHKQQALRTGSVPVLATRNFSNFATKNSKIKFGNQ